MYLIHLCGHMLHIFYYIYISMAYLYIYKTNSFSNVLNGTNTEHIPFAFDKLIIISQRYKKQMRF